MRVPTSTYRLQIREQFDLYDAARVLPYLHELGVDWVYLSPLLAAEPGSDHGYDVVAHDHVDLSRGGAEGLAAVSAEARRLGLGVLVDIVPNHVGVATPPENAWWWELLRDGAGGPRARAFDVDWAAGDGRIRIPVVGDGDEGSIRVEDGEVRYHQMRFPLAPGTTGHDEQHYELVNWREADDRLNYRRFFAVNTLAAIRVEDPEVFAESHVEIRRWFADGLVDGLRVDHPDGLRDPAAYLEDLAGLTDGGYVLGEKILESGEELLPSWSTAGTTGYDALAYVDRVLTDPAGEAPLGTLEDGLRGAPVDWHRLTHDTKRAVADGILGSEVNRIVRELDPVVEGALAHGSRPPTEEHTRDAIAELLACFPVYRSYLPEGREHLDEAFALARRHRPDLAATLDVLEPVLADPGAAPALRFQQTSGMVMAKGVEDCAFYRWSRLTSLNEVGGDPSVFAVAPADFHGWAAERLHEWPHAMTCASTHDTKRGEDVRSRIAVLAEAPDLWQDALKRLLERAPAPDPGFANLLWQAIVGAWPADRDDAPPPGLRQRLHAYAEKAMREAGDRTTWTEPDEEFEAAIHRCVDAAFDDEAVQRVLRELVARIAGPGWSNALSAKLLGLTIPGVPDVYQGSELWEQSLVDPDNRRPVDFDLRARLLEQGDVTLRPTPQDAGAAKLAVVRAALRLRRDRGDLFTSYDPVVAEGEATDHALTFDRGGAITVVTRLPLGLEARGGWGGTALRLPVGSWTEQVSGRRFTGRVALSDLLADLPVALLALEDVR